MDAIYYVVGILVAVIAALMAVLRHRSRTPALPPIVVKPPSAKPVADAGKDAVRVVVAKQESEVTGAVSSDTPASDLADVFNTRKTDP